MQWPEATDHGLARRTSRLALFGIDDDGGWRDDSVGWNERAEVDWPDRGGV